MEGGRQLDPGVALGFLRWDPGPGTEPVALIGFFDIPEGALLQPEGRNAVGQVNDGKPGAASLGHQKACPFRSPVKGFEDEEGALEIEFLGAGKPLGKTDGIDALFSGEVLVRHGLLVGAVPVIHQRPLGRPGQVGTTAAIKAHMHNGQG